VFREPKILVAVQLDRKERQLKSDAHVNNLRLDQATFDRTKEMGGLVLMEHLNPAPEALLRVLVRDVVSGVLGSLTVPLRRQQLSSALDRVDGVSWN
jgi:hypothetical protein